MCLYYKQLKKQGIYALCCRQPECDAHETCEYTVNAIFIPYTTYHIPYTIYQNGPTEQNIMNIFFRIMALADPIFNLVVGFQLFCAAFDPACDSGNIKRD